MKRDEERNRRIRRKRTPDSRGMKRRKMVKKGRRERTER